MPSEDHIIERERRIPVFRGVDVCVVGGSQSGVAAAVCAARNGVSVLLIERDPYLGGQSVGTMVTQWEKRAFINNMGAVATRGIAKEFLDAILAKGGSDQLWFDPPGCEEMRDGEEWLDVEAIKLTLLEFCEAAGVEILLSTLVVDAIVDRKSERPRVTGVIIENKSGRQAVLARVVVDASADLDVVWHSVGKEGVVIRPVEERVRPGYYTYFGGVNNEAFIEYVIENENVRGYPSRLKSIRLGSTNPDKIRHHLRTGRLLYFRGFADVVDQADKEGLTDVFREVQKQGLADSNRSIIDRIKWVGRDLWIVPGISLKPFDATNAEELTKYECLRMKLDQSMLRVLRKIPGWENAYIARRAQRIGLRETRVLRAVTMLTEKEIFNPDHDRPDAIGRSGGHDPGKNIYKEKRGVWHEGIRKAYPIPYGCLIPEKLDGVICAARAIGVKDRVSLNAHRGIVPTIVVGQAAGTAAALAVKRNVEPREVDVPELRNILRDADVVLDVETIDLGTIPPHLRRAAH